MIRKARMDEVPEIQKLLDASARRGELLPRALGELYDSLRDFQVSTDPRGRILGCCALHPAWERLGEIRSLAVREGSRNHGIGRELVGQCLEDARELGIDRVFVLTFSPGFFEKLRFSHVSKSMLPHKIWADCVRCIHFPDCKEQALWIDLGNPSTSKKSRSALL